MMKSRKYLSFTFILFFLFACGNDGAESDFAPSTAGTGIGGSLASFLVTGNNLYVVSGRELRSFSLVEGDGLVPKGTLRFDSFLETISLYENRILIGSNDAVFFVDISDQDNPELLSEYRHFTSCDPVVARRGIAYSTLRTTGCRFNGEELLDVIDFSDIENPRTIASYNVDTPYGLSVTSDFLFVCESGGISVIDNSDPASMVWVDKFKFDSGAIPFDLIYTGDIFIVITDIGIYNMEYDDAGQLTVLGEITAS